MLDIQQGKYRTSQGTEPSDGILLGQSLAGDEYAFESLVSRYRGPLLNYIRRIIKDSCSSSISLDQSY
ncbi:MAG: hypothetical protein E6I32_00450 [Chloroflexi bacterium]|nr:MAG: hypothetical protein E6I32_00450 [Chloroflexota bacterium]